ncbi:unnamed protein product, partial [Didymodactylos carnosus]
FKKKFHGNEHHFLDTVNYIYLSTASLQNAINDFKNVADKFQSESKLIDKTNPLSLRIVNDQLIQLERAFINPLGNSIERSDVKHVVYAPSRKDQYNAAGFPTIFDAIEDNDIINTQRQIAITTYFIRSAVSVLQQPTKLQTTSA